MLRRGRACLLMAIPAVLFICSCSHDVGGSSASATVSSEQEAFESAEKVFRQYISALNRIEVADASSFEDAFDLTTGQLNQLDRKNFSEWHADGWVESGDLTIEALEGYEYDAEQSVATLNACLDASEVSVVDSTGASQVNPSRQTVQSIQVRVERNGASGRWLVEQIAIPKSGGLAC